MEKQKQKGKMEAEKEGKAVTEFLEEGHFDRVSHHANPWGTLPLSVDDLKASESRINVFNGIMDALEDASVYLIGVHGMAGIGKSRLIKEVASKVKEDKTFDAVVVAVVTHSPDIKNIQYKIANELDITLWGKDERGRAEELFRAMKTMKNILLILDDIRERLNLETIGIPYGHHHEGSCKILVASRSSNLLLEMNTQKIFPVGILDPEEAWHLFKKIGGDGIESPDLQSTAVEVAKECAGLPIVISTVARALRNKSSMEWEAALQKLKSPSKNKTTLEVIQSAVKLSYDHLRSEELKLSFVLCCLMGNNAAIEDFLKYGVGLGLFTRIDTIDQARDKALALVLELKESFLLLDSYSGKLFDVHDVVCDFAISIASKNHHLFVVKDEDVVKDWSDGKKIEDSNVIVLQNSNIAELPSRLNCPQLKFFYLGCKNPFLKFPTGFFSNTQELKVLHLNNVNFLSLPLSIRVLANLYTLCLNECRLEDISILGELLNLEILSLSGSDIEKLPWEIGNLRRLRLLDLNECTKLREIPPSTLSRLDSLEELYMRYSFCGWEIEEHNSNASLAELDKLSHLSNLDIRISDVMMMPKGFLFGRFSRHRIVIGNYWSHKREYEGSRTVKIGVSCIDRKFNDWSEELLNETEELYLYGLMANVVNLRYLFRGKRFQHLKNLHFQNFSETIQYIFNPKHWTAFPNLESLFLIDFTKLEKICYGTDILKLDRLRIVKVEGCHKLKNLFSFSIFKNFFQLQEIKVVNCRDIQELVADERSEELEENTICNIQSLKLRELPELISFSVQESTDDLPKSDQALFNEKIMFPCLEDVQLFRLNIERIWENKLATTSCCGQNLRSLMVKCCLKLKYLLSYSVASCLVQLKHLQISECSEMRKIIETDDEEEREEITEAKIVCPCLEDLQLSGLHKLETTSCCGHNLRSLIIGGCHELKYLLSYSVASCLVQLKHLQIKKCYEMRKIVETDDEEEREEITEAKIVFPQLNSIRMEDLPELEAFYLGNSTIEFPSLERVIVEKCWKLKVFSRGVLSTPKLRNIKIYERGSEGGGIWGKDLNTAIQKHYKQKLKRLYETLDEDAKVFLSFRDEDTCKNFTDDLYAALISARLKTFRDDDELPRGEDISSELLKAIQDSKISIVVFSKGYASSRWCLNELLKIIECRKTTGQIVIPIFYDVGPFDVREQRGIYAKAFIEHKRRFKTDMEMIQRWRKALSEAANIYGWDLQNRPYEVGMIIKKIVDDVLRKVGKLRKAVAFPHNVSIKSEVKKEFRRKLEAGPPWEKSLSATESVPSAENLEIIPSAKHDIPAPLMKEQGGHNLEAGAASLQGEEAVPWDWEAKATSMQEGPEGGGKQKLKRKYETEKEGGFEPKKKKEEGERNLEAGAASMQGKVAFVPWDWGAMSQEKKVETLLSPPVDMTSPTIKYEKDQRSLPERGEEINEAEVISAPEPERSAPLEKPSSAKVPSFRGESIPGIVPDENASSSTTSADGQFSRVAAGLTEPPTDDEWKQSKMMFLMDNKLSTLPEKPNCPKLVKLCLQKNYHLRVIPDLFFHSMPLLEELNLSNTRIKYLPKSVSNLVKLEKLVLRDCERLVNLPSEVGSLKLLQVLDLGGTEIIELPNEISKLVCLSHMEVTFYGSSTNGEHNKLPRKWISSLQALQTLRISVYPGDNWWNKNAGFFVKEVTNLKMLTSFSFFFPEVEFLELFLGGSASWKEESLTEFQFVVGRDVKFNASRVPQFVELNNGPISGQCLRFVNSEKTPDAILEVLARCSAFCLDHHLDIRRLSDFRIGNFNKLKYCIISECPNLETIVDNKEGTKVVFPCLEHLSIHYSWSLTCIWEGVVPEGSFAALRTLSLHACPKLTYVFKSSMLQFLSNLEKLQVDDCEAIEKIISAEEDTESCCISLKSLRLNSLPKLIHISEGVQSKLLFEYISVYDCPQLKQIFVDSELKQTLKEIRAEKDWWDELVREEKAIPSDFEAIFAATSEGDCIVLRTSQVQGSKN